MTKKKKESTDEQRVEKVKRLLKKFEPWDGAALTIRDAVVIGLERGTYAGECVLFHLGGGRLALSRGMSIDGIIGGFNRSAPEVVSGLRQLRLLTHADEEAFERWFSAEEKQQFREDDLERAGELAEKHGFVLRKKPKRKVA